MQANKPIPECRFSNSSSSLTLTILFTVLFWTLSACSSGDDSGARYRVQGGVYFEQGVPYATALVVDQFDNFISDAVLTINERPMNVEFIADPSQDAESPALYPYYFLALPDLKGGDAVIFNAKTANGVTFYSPVPAVVPTEINLVNPSAGDTIKAGDMLEISWTGGDGASAYTAGYSLIEGANELWELINPEDDKALMVPEGLIGGGPTIFAVSAVSGDTTNLSSGPEAIEDQSYFFVSRAAGIEIDVEQPLATTYSEPAWACGTAFDLTAAQLACTGEFAALGIGAIIWETRRQMDFKCGMHKDMCNYFKKEAGWSNAMEYCVKYSMCGSHNAWKKGCVRCQINPYYDFPGNYCTPMPWCQWSVRCTNSCGDVCGKECR